MPTVYIPNQMRDLTGGASRIESSAATVRALIVELDQRYPGIAARLRDGDGLVPGIQVSINGALSSRGLLATIPRDAEIHFLPAIGGG